MLGPRDPNALIISPPPSMIEVDQVSSSHTLIPTITNGKQRGSPSDDLLTYDSKSITSSVIEYEYENGRRYHGYKAGSYPLPNDEKELDRIDLKHHIMMMLCDGHLHLAPLHNPSHVLDIGTGTGIWAIEMGEQYPDSEVYGVDLSPVQPSWVPENVHFEVDDVEAKDWTWPDNHFDYIHSRFMLTSFGNWKRFIRKAFQHTKPGGYFELQELNCRFASDDGSLKEDSSLSYWSTKITEAAENYNRPVPLHTDYMPWFERAGFVDIKQVVIKSPTNPWPKDKKLKEVGKYQLLAHIEGLEGISMGLLTRGAEPKWKADEVSVLMAKLRPELKDRSIHSYQTNVIVVGRKPETPQTPDSLHDRRAFGWGQTASSSSSFNQPGQTPENITPQTSQGDTPAEGVSAFTPVVPIAK